MGVDNVTIIVWNSDGEIIVNTTVSNDVGHANLYLIHNLFDTSYEL